MECSSRSLPLVALEAARLTSDGRTLLDDIDFEIRTGEVWQIHGSKGAGKSLLLEVLLGRHRITRGRRTYPAFVERFPDATLGIAPRFAVRLVSQSEQRRVASEQASFYQARWHSLWVEPITVTEFLSPPRVLGLRPFEILSDLSVRRDYDVERSRCLDELNLVGQKEQSVGQLSNGELRKLLLAAAHLAAPRLLLLDDPLSGLDPDARVLVTSAIRRWIAEGQTLAFCASHAEDLRGVASHHLTLAAGRIAVAPSAEGDSTQSQVGHALAQTVRLGSATEVRDSNPCPDERGAQLTAGVHPSTVSRSELDPILTCHGLRVIAGTKVLLDDVEWQVRPGEHWMITGPNGAGKSTLLSLILGDHPQAYSNDITVFGGRLGQGTTIWQRREQIGFMAPELSWHYPLGWSLFDVVASGLDSSIGRYRDLSSEEATCVSEWLACFDLGDRVSQPLANLSEGEKRLTLLARAMVRRPRLLLLDEPTQALTARERDLLHEHLDRLGELGATTLVLVTHHPNERPRCITHHLELAGGRVVSTMDR